MTAVHDALPALAPTAPAPADRWAGIRRPYTPADVERLRPSIRIRHTLAELGAARLWELLTTRDYVQGCAFLVALWGGDLAGAQAALRRPAFAPYLGRRSCPLAAPLDPRVVAAETPVAALLAPREVPEWLAGAKPVRVASDAFDGVAAHPGYMVESRWDEPLDRSLWHFARREVYVLPLVPAGGPS